MSVTKILAVLVVLIAATAAFSALPRNVTGYKMVPKIINKKMYVHVMPWFESKETSEDGNWGQHWTMARMNPDIIENGKRQIACHYYPDIGPYGSGDETLIDYQIQMMKYAGVDGVLMDWPGTTIAWDYPKNMQNADRFIQKLWGYGMEFAIVYEDHNLGMARDAGFITDIIAQGRQDMAWLQSNYFRMENYIHINGAPLLMTFGPQTLRDNDWPAIFEPLGPKPTFLTLWNQFEQTAGTAVGEYPWIYVNFMLGLENFYKYREGLQVKFGVAYPGFHDFYQQGGWPGHPGWIIQHEGTGTFQQTLNLALQFEEVEWIQAATWNDYGEGTMIEPTKEFGNSFLNVIQSTLKVPYGNRELDLIKELYLKRKANAGKSEVLTVLDEISEALRNLNPDRAERLLKSLR